MSTSTKDRTHGSATTDRQAKVSPKQPSAEQRRIADLMIDKTDISELQGKVEKIIELTNATRDEAVVALHDCDNSLDRAIDMILEGESVKNTEWISTGKKKKPKAVVVSQSSQPDKEDKSNANESSYTGDKKVSSNRGRGGPRLQRGAGGSGKSSNWKQKDEKSDITSENNENTAPDDNANNKNLPPRRGDSRRGRGRGSTRGNFSNRGTGGGRGARLFQNKGYRNTTTTANSSNNDGFPNSIDTWTNSTADQANSKLTNECTTMNVGNWSDFAGNEDWSEEDWDSSLMETKVFTPSTKALTEKEDIGGDLPSNPITNSTNQGLNFGSLLGKQSNDSPNQPSQQSMSSILGSNVPRSSATNSSAGAALLQQLQQQAVSSQASPQINKFSLSQYTKQATENIKSLVGIPTTTYNSNNANIMNSDSLDNQVSDLSQRQLEVAVDNSSGSLSSAKPPRLTVKRSSKIPESAVEMPSNDSISALNVQFGAMPFDLGPEANNAFHDAVNHVKSKTNQVKPAPGPTSVPGANSLGSSGLLNQAVSDNAFRAANNNQNTGSGNVKSSAGTASDLVLQNSVLGHQTIAAEMGLDRNKAASANYGTKVLDGNHNKNIYQSGPSQVQTSSKTSTGDMSSYKNTSYPQADPTSAYGANINYGASTTSTPYYSTNQTPGAYSSATNYSNFQPVSAATSHVNVSGQKTGGIKDLDASNTQHKHNYDLTQGVPNVAPGGSLGLVSNSTVTTNVLKNSLTATGKGIPNVPPGVTPLMGTQYIMSQAGLSAFYPFYDVSSIPTAPHARDHNFAYSANTDLKYSRADNDGSNVVSTQSPVSQTHNQAIFGQIPHAAYSFFYTPGVNMMPQSLYGPAAPIFPVTPATNTGSTGSAFPKGTTGYGSHSYASAGYDSLAAVPPPTDYVKTNYGPSTGQQQVKGINVSNANDLSGSNAMYGKSHPQLNKSYDKPTSFQTATPPPFNMAGAQQANTLGSTYAPQPPNQYIPMMPQTQPSMLHHTLQADTSQSGGAGVGGQRSMYQAQKGSAPNNKSYWNQI